MKEMTSFIITATKKIKYLEINLMRNVENLHVEKLKI